MLQKRDSYKTLFITALSVLFLASSGIFTLGHRQYTTVVSTASATAVNVIPSTNIAPVADRKLSGLDAAGSAICSGDFDMARQYLDSLDPSAQPSPSVRKLQVLLERYDQLTENLREVHHTAHQQYLDKVRERVQRAHWRQNILDASLASRLEAEDKDKLEEKHREKVRDNWLAALSQLVAANNLAERMELIQKVAPELREEIITHVLDIARNYESQDKALEAYGNVYGLLSILDGEKYQYDELHSSLLRQSILTAIYAPDPNTEGVSWQDRRKGVTFDMIRTAFGTIDYAYVEKPDFKAMIKSAFEYCLFLTETEKLNQTFEQLDDAALVKTFRERLQEKNLQIEQATTFDYTTLLTKLLEVIIINRETLKLPDEVIMAEFTEGAFSALDANTEIKWPADVEEFEKAIYNEFSGIGIVINKNKDNILHVDSLVSYDAPAFKAGLEADDLIIAVDGKDTKKITLSRAVQLITGPSNTDVVLTVNRKGFEQPKDFTVTRQHVVVPTVKGLYRDINGRWEHFLDPNDGVAYINLTHFSPETPARLMHTLRQLRKQNMRALILDLRNNQGGLLSGAVGVSDMFISRGDIVSARYYRSQKIDTQRATDSGTFDDELPMVVLINSISASASEIVAGALKDHNRALTVGTRSFGKGSVQTIHQIPGTKAQMKLTVAYYYLPSGRKVHRDPDDKSNKDYGVEPQIEVEMTGKQIEKYVKVHHDAGVLHRNDLPPEARTWKVFNPDEILQSDPQLQFALLNLRAKLWAKIYTPATNAYTVRN